MKKLVFLFSVIYGLLTLGGVFLKASLVAGPLAAPSQISEAYGNVSPTVSPRLSARIIRTALQSLDQSTDDLSAVLNEQRQSSSRVRRGRRSVAFQAPPLVAGGFLPADATCDLRSLSDGLRYGRSPPEA